MFMKWNIIFRTPLSPFVFRDAMSFLKRGEILQAGHVLGSLLGSPVGFTPKSGSVSNSGFSDFVHFHISLIKNENLLLPNVNHDHYQISEEL